MARNQYYNQITTPFSTFHRSKHDGISYLDIDFLSICPACASPLLLADTIYNINDQFKGKTPWLNTPYIFVAEKCKIPYFNIWYTVNEISEKERPIIEFHIKRIYPKSDGTLRKLTPDEMLQYLEWKVQQHIPKCTNKKYLLKRVTSNSEHNADFKRLNNYVKLLSK